MDYICRKLMDFVAVFTIGRQFPDKAIDLIDEACTAKIKRAISENSLKGAAVEPNDVAQVSIFLQRHVCLLFQSIFVMQILTLTLSFEGCEPMDWNSCMCT
jgi:hypothetical protein